MDERKMRILTLMILIKQLYHHENNRLTDQQKVYKIRKLIINEPLIKEFNLTREQIDMMIVNIINANRKKKSTKKKRKKTRKKISKKKGTRKRGRKKIKAIDNTLNLNDLVRNINKNDNEINRNILRNFIKHHLKHKQKLDTIYNLYFKSVKDNNIPLLNIMVDSGIDINAQDYDGNTGLHYAVYFRRINIMMILLQNDAKINLKNRHKYKPIDLINNSLLYNIKGGSKDDMKKLLNYRKKRTFKINTSVSLFGKHDNLININSEDDLNKIDKHEGILLFYMIKCGWCKKMQGDIKMLCNRGVKVYVMENNQINTNIRNKYDINGFPTIYILKNGKHEKYTGERSYTSIENILK